MPLLERHRPPAAPHTSMAAHTVAHVSTAWKGRLNMSTVRAVAGPRMMAAVTTSLEAMEWLTGRMGRGEQKRKEIRWYRV